ncbi:E3 ubiquitin- ligase HECTD1 [Brachionus plicatilis]|uniref:E3 ubiquitin-ligase HECTD1 n=1 Tax=Brachionus plicatilis TaxID=10195 RepID=A0A3M7P4S4_BRAPC|nr:E3 ubiquitin- ligase HECTD1 [Brachionus plicatilis]
MASGKVEDFLGRVETSCHTTGSENRLWFVVNFSMFIVPTHYTLRYSNGFQKTAPRNWAHTHSNDDSLRDFGQWCTWSVAAKDGQGQAEERGISYAATEALAGEEFAAKADGARRQSSAWHGLEMGQSGHDLNHYRIGFESKFDLNLAPSHPVNNMQCESGARIEPSLSDVSKKENLAALRSKIKFKFEHDRNMMLHLQN